MRTNIDLDEDLIEKARWLTWLKTKRAVVEEALRSLIQLREQADVRALRGKQRWEGDLELMRASRLADAG